MSLMNPVTNFGIVLESKYTIMQMVEQIVLYAVLIGTRQGRNAKVSAG